MLHILFDKKNVIHEIIYEIKYDMGNKFKLSIKMFHKIKKYVIVA